MQTTLVPMENGQLEVALPVVIEETEEPLTLKEETEILSNLTQELQKMKITVNLLAHRVNTLQDLLDQERFEWSSMELKVKSNARAAKVRDLLAALELQEENLIMGDFLTALNKWLIHNARIDLNDLQILMNPLLSSAFCKPLGLKKMPYPLLLLALDKMFV